MTRRSSTFRGPKVWLRLLCVSLLSLLTACAAAVTPLPPRSTQAEVIETSTIADADEGEEETKGEEPEYRAKTVIDFDGDLAATGTVAQPETITARRRPTFRPMTRQPSVRTATSSRR